MDGVGAYCVLLLWVLMLRLIWYLKGAVVRGYHGLHCTLLLAKKLDRGIVLIQDQLQDINDICSFVHCRHDSLDAESFILGSFILGAGWI